MSSSNPYAPADAAPETIPEPVVVAPAEQVVPRGPIKEVIDWVGDDATRAQTALKSENSGRSRKSVVTALEAVVAKNKKSHR